MFKLLKNGECYAPEYIGKKDILVVYGKICRLEANIPVDNLWDVEVFDCTNKIISPGFIDQHLHITGGGGEEGPASRIPEIMLSDVTTAGVTTVVGVLGVDGVTRNIQGLLAKARALEVEGITSFIYTGSYNIPTATLTGRVVGDIAIIDKVIGVGEIAISDHRSSQPTLEMLRETASQARVGGLVGGKAGVMHMHVGDGKEGLAPLQRLIEESDFPIEMFIPTHLNRNKRLFGQAMEYAAKGGFIDLTAGEKTDTGYSVPDALEIIINKGIDIGKVSVSSDGNGSMPSKDGNGSEVGKVIQFFNDIKSCILSKNIDMETALKTVTSNVAKILKIYPQKGKLAVNSDADILVLDKGSLEIDKLFARGEILVDSGKAIKKGRFEK